MSQVLVIAGLDPSGGAGLLMDIKVLTLQGIRASAIPSALTFQSYSRFEDWVPVDSDSFERMLKLLFEDLKIEGVKLGMLATPEIVEITALYLERYRPQIRWIVADPVLKATLKKPLFRGEAFGETLKKRLFPLVDVLTPNLAEAEALTGVKVRDLEDIKEALYILQGFGIRFPVITGLKRKDRILSVFPGEKGGLRFLSVRALPAEFHGTGCALSSALLAYLIKGHPERSALRKSLNWLWKRLKKGLKPEEEGSSRLSSFL
jgi:hydroxymethylpyrimidine/phosphomethylpyrimidine kinase